MHFTSGLFVLLLSASAVAQHTQGDHGNPLDTSHVPDHLKNAYSSADPLVHEARKEVVKRLYTELIHPGPLPVLAGTKPIHDIFQEGVVQGRVSPAGSYSDYTSAMEYFYALAATPLTHVYKVDFRSLLSSDDKAAVEVDLYFCRFPFTACDGNALLSSQGFILKEIGFFTFNEENRIISFDLVIPNLGAAMDIKDPKLRDNAIVQMCVMLTQMHQDPISGSMKGGGTCTSSFDRPDDFAIGTRDQYGTSPFQNCLTFMHTLPFGTWDRANSNTVVCRQLHSLLTPLRPADHCPHVSPAGGGKCIDFPYESYFEKDY